MQMLNPQQFTNPLRTGARQQVNNAYSGAGDSLAQRFLGYGGGQSGKHMRAVRGAELGRLGGLADVENTFANLNLQQMMHGQGAVERLLQIGRGTETESEGTVPGNPVGAGLSSGLETATFLYGLNSLLKGGGAAAGGGGIQPFDLPTFYG